MTDETIDQKLRDMAEHRGFKLVKSRKRKPGTGDFGKFGLTDASGNPLLGIGDAGLEASPEDVETYLRAGATSTWKASADSTPSRPTAPSAPRNGEVDPEPEEIAIRPRGKRGATTAGDRKVAPVSRAPKEPAPPSTTPRTYPKRPVKTAPPSKPAPEPELVIRAAKAADAAGLLPLLRQLTGVKIDELAVARNLKAALKADAGMAVAEVGDLVGCCAWAVIPTIQHGPVGRLTVLLVAEDHRRKGIATALLDAAVNTLRKAGCTALEAMSDIEVKNAHNFFRTLKFEQTSYRFARSIDAA